MEENTADIKNDFKEICISKLLKILGNAMADFHVRYFIELFNNFALNMQPEHVFPGTSV